MKKVHIIALHLGYGGIEKAVCSMANLFAERYNVEIICVYDMPDAPAYPIDGRVNIRYLLSDVPNRKEWRAAIEAKAPGAILRESLKGARILHDKRKSVADAIKGIYDGVIITTRHEDNLLLSKYGGRNVLKIAQIHHDHRFEKSMVNDLKRGYGNIDILTMLTPGLRDEVKEMMKWENDHTNVVYIPNFLEHFPDVPDKAGREKTVLAVGRLDEVKRFDLLIEEFIRIHEAAPDWRLRIAGDGKEKERLKSLIEENGAEGYITLLGRLEGAQVEKEMLGASVYAMTSRSEGFPFVLLEAQSCGLPVVAYDVRVGPGFVIHDGEDGYLIPEGDSARFRARLLELMENEALRWRMAQAAMRAAAEFSKEKIGETWYSVIGD